MNKTTLNSQKEKHSMLSLRRATRPGQRLQSVTGFLSTLSLRRATFQGPGLVRHGVDFYPRSPCGERLGLLSPTDPRQTISIHALLAESDGSMPTTWVARPQFLSTLSLRRATETPRRQPHSTQFLSTLSLRRATCYSLRHSTSRWYFYPRSPCGERQ